ncbi:MAG TPA: flagellar assembly protein FliW [Paenibacillus sp.]|jgi:flagellar assembly factor FliW
MNIHTTAWGDIEINEDQIFRFDHGLLGFEGEKEFVIIDHEEGPFCFLQSILNPDLSFVLSDPFTFYPNYEFELLDSEREELALASQVMIYCMVTLNSNIKQSTLNLLAPVVFNPERKLAKQVALHHSTYQTRHLLFTEEFDKSSKESV